MGRKPKYVDVRPGCAGRLLPKKREGVVPDDLRLGKIERELSVRDEVVRKHHEDKRVLPLNIEVDRKFVERFCRLDPAIQGERGE
jgi:hypothetical protein